MVQLQPLVPDCIGKLLIIDMPGVTAILGTLLCLGVLRGAQGALLDDYVNAGPAYLHYEYLPALDLNGTGKAFDKGLSWTAQVRLCVCVCVCVRVSLSLSLAPTLISLPPPLQTHSA